MMFPDPNNPNPFMVGGQKPGLFPQKPPMFAPPPQTLPSMGMPGGNPTGPAAPPGGGGPGVGQIASAIPSVIGMKDQAPGNAMIAGASTGAMFGPVGAGIGAGAGLLMSILGGGKKSAPRPALLLPPRR